MAPAAKKQRLSDGGVASIEAIEAMEEVLPATTAAKVASTTTKAAPQTRSLFVRALAPETTTESLTELFSESYPIKHATAIVDPATKLCKGYGFVTFADAEDALRAKQEFNGRLLKDRKLRVELAEPRNRDETGEKLPKEKAEKEAPASTKLIVRNLPWSIKGSNQLEKLFQSYGKIKQAYVPKKGPGLMAGFGFVVMRGRKHAEKALEGVNGKTVDGRTLAVDWAVEKGVYDGLQAPEERNGAGAEDEADGGVKLDEDEDQELFARDVTDESDEGSEDEAEDEDEDDMDMGEDGDEEEEEERRPEDRSSTIFVRNLPFTCTDEDLEDHFTRFGSVRYGRVVMDMGTGRSKGTGFVAFYNRDDVDTCLRSAPRRTQPSEIQKDKDGKVIQAPTSILQNDDADPSGQYTLDSRVLQVSRAVDKSEANRLTEEGKTHRNKRDNDKRRLYLLSEGTISTKSSLYEKLSPSEKTMREASAKQRKTLIESNPSLHLSLTRLSVRNVPRSVDSKELKALAREAVVGFATDVKGGKRQRLAREELERGGDEMVEADAARKRAGKGIVRQAKVVFEGSGGSKVGEETGAGRSRGYGFIEYYTHRSALMGLRWLNGHAVGYKVNDSSKGSKRQPSKDEMQDRKKRLVVEFAIENAQVVLRRHEREHKARERSKAVHDGRVEAAAAAANGEDAAADKKAQNKDGKTRPGSRKRKRDLEADRKAGKKPAARPAAATASATKKKAPVDEKTAKRNQIIGRKRAARKMRKGGK
ncbi:RNA recognition motif-containing protein [Recurvomyces mirabilis]|nr:RNA recognition motif-containing protein [Recurvomyces mirabilis]